MRSQTLKASVCFWWGIGCLLKLQQILWWCITCMCGFLVFSQIWLINWVLLSSYIFIPSAVWKCWKCANSEACRTVLTLWMLTSRLSASQNAFRSCTLSRLLVWLQNTDTGDKVKRRKFMALWRGWVWGILLDLACPLEGKGHCKYI